MESEYETAYQIDVATDCAAVSAGRQPLNAAVACPNGLCCWRGTSRTVMYYAYRGWRCQSAATSDGQHIMHTDILPMWTIVGAVNQHSLMDTGFYGGNS